MNCSLDLIYHKPLMMHDSRSQYIWMQRAHRLLLPQKLTRSHAKQMVAIREAKRAALKASVSRGGFG